MKIKTILSIIVLALCITILGGCDNSGSGDITIKTMSMFGGKDSHGTTYQNIISQFEKDNKGVKIEDNSASSDEIWKSSVLSSFYSGSQPDVLYFFNGATAKPLVDNGYVVSIADIQKEYPEYAKNISPSVLDPYCIPLSGFVEGIFVNKALFTGDLAPYLEKTNWSWTDFMTVCSKLKDNDITPVALGGENEPHYWIEHLILAMNGKEAYNSIPKAADFDGTTAKGWVDALKLFNTLADAGVFGATKGIQQADSAKTLFKTGKAAMYLDGSWFAGQLENSDGTKADGVTIEPKNIGLVPFPSISKSMGGQEKVYMQSGFTSGFYISKKAWDNEQKRDLVVDFVMKMTSTAAITEFCKAAGGAPADPSVDLSATQTPLQQSITGLPNRTQDSTLPLSDAAKSGSFQNLVMGISSYINWNETGALTALKAFANAQ